MAKQDSEANINHVCSVLGCTREVARNALNITTTKESAIAFILEGNSTPTAAVEDDMQRAINESMKTHQNEQVSIAHLPPGISQEDAQMQEQLFDSVKKNNTGLNSNYEPLAPQERKREAGIPVGLKNVGNSCYFESQAQMYFNIPEFVKLVFELEIKNPSTQVSNSTNETKDENPCMVQNLKYLFASLIKSNKKYSDVLPVLNQIRDELGKPIPIGDQKDISEFHLKFVDSLINEIKDQTEGASQEEAKEEAKEPAVEPDFNRNESALDTQDTPTQAALRSRIENPEEVDAEMTEEEQIEVPSASDTAIDRINKIFTGKIRQDILYELNGEKKMNTSVDEFKFIYLDSKDKDLYNAWEGYFQTNLEGYKPDDKVCVNACKQRWIQELPKVLIFLVSRVLYDNKTQSSYKVNDSFDFDEVIYPDRYMMENRQTSDQLRSQVNELRKKCLLLQEHIEKFKNYNEKNQELGSVLHSTIHLLKANTEEMDSDSTAEGVTLYSPENIIKQLQDKPSSEDLQKMIGLLTNVLDTTQEKVKDMEKQLSDLQAQIKDYYRSVDKTPYYLHSLMVHDGNHESGHYYAFISDPSKGVYRRYNDHRVEEVSKEKVFEESRGGYRVTSAYCLVYVNQEVYDECSQPNLHNYGLQYRDTPSDDVYNSLVPPELANMVYDDNDKLEKLIQEERCNELAKEIRALYDKRWIQIKEFLEKYKAPREYSSSITQFLTVPKNATIAPNENIAKWLLLEMCVRETSTHSLTDQTHDMESLKSVITTGMINNTACKDFPRHTYLSDGEMMLYAEKMSEFPEAQKKAATIISIMQNIVEDNYKVALCAIVKQMEFIPDLKGYNIVRDAAKVLALNYTSRINQAIISKKAFEQGILPCLHGLVYIFKNIITDLSDNHYGQVLVNLKMTYDVAQNKMEGYKEQFESWIETFENKNFDQVELDNTWEAKFPGDLLEYHLKIEHTNNYVYNEVYNENNIGNIFQQTLTSFKEGHEAWVKVHRSIFKRQNNVKTGIFYLQAEEEIGIKLREYAAS